MSQTVLADLINRRLDEMGVSLRTACKGHINVSTLGAYSAGSDSRPSTDTMRAIAKAIKVPVRRVEVAAGCPPMRDHFELPKDADRLSARERRAVLAVVDALLAAHYDGAGPESARSRSTG